MLLPLVGCRAGTTERAERSATAVAADVTGVGNVTGAGDGASAPTAPATETVAPGPGPDQTMGTGTGGSGPPPTYLPRPDEGTANGDAVPAATTEVSSVPATTTTPTVAPPAVTAAPVTTPVTVERTPLATGNWDVASEQSIVALLNERRAGVGLPPLASDPRLADSARGQVARMIATQVLAHQDLHDDLDQGWSIVGENVGYGPDTLSIHQALVASPGHDANLVHTQYRYVGVGVEVDANGRMWVSQVFGG